MEKTSGLTSKMSLAIMLLALIWAAGCATQAQTGAVGGAGVGALMGQLIGGNTKSTLIGAAVGTGLGYIIGNEVDKADAKSRDKVTVEETRPLAGTTWLVTSVVPRPKIRFESIICHFKPEGTVVTTKTYTDGKVETGAERYRIVGSTLIVNQNDYIVNATFRIEGNQMIIDTGKHSVVLRRVDI